MASQPGFSIVVPVYREKENILACLQALERLERINRTLSTVPQEALSSARIGLRPIKVLFLSPSQSIERIAVKSGQPIPRTR